jgi:hypothetical protein
METTKKNNKKNFSSIGTFLETYLSYMSDIGYKTGSKHDEQKHVTDEAPAAVQLPGR